MKTSIPVINISFERLIDLFIKKSKELSILDRSIGRGYLQIFELEAGLQVRFWDCCFSQEIETHSHVASELKNSYVTLAFFLDMQGVQFTNRGTVLPENIIWDTVFISAVSDYKIHVAPGAVVRCMSISFSKKWLNNNVFKASTVFDKLREQIDTIESFSILESMSLSEKKIIGELLDAFWQKPFGSFYIKSGVLKIIYDFFYKLKERHPLNIDNISPAVSIAAVEKYLCDHLSSPLPDLKHLAHEFAVSESTLKRHFKKRYGVNMSTYFIKRKMEYAQQLLQDENKSMSEAASMLGYRNVNNFITILKKHVKSRE